MVSCTLSTRSKDEERTQIRLLGWSMSRVCVASMLIGRKASIMENLRGQPQPASVDCEVSRTEGRWRGHDSSTGTKISKTVVDKASPTSCGTYTSALSTSRVSQGERHASETRKTSLLRGICKPYIDGFFLTLLDDICTYLTSHWDSLRLKAWAQCSNVTAAGCGWRSIAKSPWLPKCTSVEVDRRMPML
jgi:hypothetical protein